jgi:hypothetical protein
MADSTLQFSPTQTFHRYSRRQLTRKLAASPRSPSPPSAAKSPRKPVGALVTADSPATRSRSCTTLRPNWITAGGTA